MVRAPGKSLGLPRDRLGIALSLGALCGLGPNLGAGPRSCRLLRKTQNGTEAEAGAGGGGKEDGMLKGLIYGCGQGLLGQIACAVH